MAPDRAGRRLMALLTVFASLVGRFTRATPLKIYAYDLPQWKDESKFGDTSRFRDIRWGQNSITFWQSAPCPEHEVEGGAGHIKVVTQPPCGSIKVSTPHPFFPFSAVTQTMEWIRCRESFNGPTWQQFGARGLSQTQCLFASMRRCTQMSSET